MLRAAQKTENPNSSAIPTMDIELFKIARQGDENKLQQIIEEKPYLLVGKTPRQNTVLHIASRLRHIKFAESISIQCPSLLVAQNCKGDTAVHLAARAELSDMVDKLIECAERKHLKEEMLTMVNREQNTALHEAARNNHERVVDLLLNHQPNLVHALNKDEASALYMAAETGCLESVKCILKEVKKLVDEETREAACQGPENRTPLHAAVMLRYLDIVEVLMLERKEFARMKDVHGSYPLHYASSLCDHYASALCGNSKMVEMILQSDTSVAYLRNGDSQLPFHVAITNGCLHVIKHFQKFCPDSYGAIDARGWNALHFAVESRKVEVVKHILNSNELGELINEPNDEGNTPLHLIFTKWNYQVFELLVSDKRVDVNVMNRKGQTALDIAICDEELLHHKMRKLIICDALLKVGGKRGLHATHKAHKKVQDESYKNMANVLLVVAGLIITVSFAAIFTIPGGFNSDGSDKGQPILARKPILWLFIITDAISLFTAILVAVFIFLTAVGDPLLLVRPIHHSLRIIVISLGSLTLAFVFGLWLVLSKVVALMFLTIFFFGFSYSSYFLFGPARSRSLILPEATYDWSFLRLVFATTTLFSSLTAAENSTTDL